MEQFNSLMTALFDFLLWPVSSLPSVVGLSIVSLVAGVLLLLIYGRVSNQQALKRTKTKIHSYILEAILFRHNIRLCLKAQLRMFAQGFVYLARAVPPILIMAVPCIIILAQLNLRYGARGLSVGEKGILKVTLADEKLLYQVRLQAPEDLKVSGPLRIPESREVVWRIEPNKAVDINLSLTTEHGELLKDTLVVQPSKAKTIPGSAYKNFWWGLFYPGLSLGEVPISSFSLSYPAQSYSLLGFEMNWLVVFLILSLASGLVASRVFKVEI